MYTEEKPAAKPPANPAATFMQSGKRFRSIHGKRMRKIPTEVSVRSRVLLHAFFFQKNAVQNINPFDWV